MWNIVLILVLLQYTSCNGTILLLSESGQGKSSLINWLGTDGTAIEGHTLNSETLCAQTHKILKPELLNWNIVDTPGLLDTRGYTDAEIKSIIMAEAVQHLSTGSISVLLIVIDGRRTRLQLKSLIESSINMFGKEVLPSIGFVINFSDKILPTKQELIREHILETLLHLYTIEDLNKRIAFVDTKGSHNTYFWQLLSVIKHCTPFTLNGLNDMKIKENSYYQQELQNEANYITRNELIPRVDTIQECEKHRPIESYSYDCNCHQRCVEWFLICLEHKWKCDTCWGTREGREVELCKNVKRVQTTTQTHRDAKYSEQELRTIARNRLAEEIKGAVFAQKNKREKEI